MVRHLREGDADALRSFLASGKIARDSLLLMLDPVTLAGAVGVASEELAPDLAAIALPLQLRRRGVEAPLVIGKSVPVADTVLLRALASAHRWMQALRAGTPLADIAREANLNEALIRTRSPLAFLSPKLQAAIRAGTQPVDLTLERIIRNAVPLDWADQERVYGI